MRRAGRSIAPGFRRRGRLRPPPAPPAQFRQRLVSRLPPPLKEAVKKAPQRGKICLCVGVAYMRPCFFDLLQGPHVCGPYTPFGKSESRCRHSGACRNPEQAGIPNRRTTKKNDKAKKQTQIQSPWIPACAGMTSEYRPYGWEHSDEDGPDWLHTPNHGIRFFQQPRTARD